MPASRYRVFRSHHGTIRSADSAQSVTGQSVDPGLVILSVEESPSPGHGSDGFADCEAALLKKVGKGARLFPRIHAGEPSAEIFQVRGREMDRVTIIAGDDGSDHMTASKFAPHGVADGLAAATQNADRRAFRKQRKQLLAVRSEGALIQCRYFFNIL